ncbi:MAG: glycosyltransferase family 39 protein, partial [Anaerolineae bacterium]
GSRSRRVAGALLVLILLLAFGLRFYGLDAQSLWNDEGSSVALAQRDLGAIARAAAGDIHPPLYYWLLSGWVRFFGTSEAAVRALSALLGVVLVALTYALGRRLMGRWVGLAAAVLAAIHPFQVYYSQEARMYMLLAVLTAGAVLALVHLVEGSRSTLAGWVALVLLEVAGLYTHYSFVFVVLILNLAYGLWLLLTRRQHGMRRRVLLWLLSQVVVVVLYLPWLPTAIRQVTTWPSPVGSSDFLLALATTWRWLVFGPTIEGGRIAVPILVAALVVAGGLAALLAGWVGRTTPHRQWTASLLALWLGLPVLLMFALGLYREAYLKFLLVVTPAVSLLLACGLLAPLPSHRDAAPRVPRGARYAIRAVQLLAAILILVPSTLALRNYYADPAYARDDYRSIATYIDALGRPGDAIVLNAPGQQEVFGYYYQGDLPVHPLPESRPLDPARTAAGLAELARPGGRVFALLWATDESDPDRFVEGWLDAQAYKALDSWVGNVRLVVYAVPERTPPAPAQRLDVRLRSNENEDEVTLLGYSLLNDQLAAGDIAQITLFWQAERTPAQRYKVFLHVLDAGNQIVGQRDAEPGGGVRLTTLWPPGEVVADNYGLPIHPATPPGEYRVEVGMYDPQTGQRLMTSEGEDQVWLAPLLVERSSTPAPVAALGMQHDAGAQFGELSLLGYDAYRLGYAHQPETALRPGEVLQANLYWRAETRPSGDWQTTIDLVDSEEREWVGLAAEPVGSYPTSLWQAGDVWRGQFNLALPVDMPPGRYRLRVQLLAPGVTPLEPFLSKPLIVEQ